MRTLRNNFSVRRALQCVLLGVAVVVFAGAGDPTSRFKELGHQLMCTCGSCNDQLLECNHIGCSVSDNMRNELLIAINRGDSDSLVQQAFVQKYGPTVLAAPTKQGFDRAAWIMPIVALFAGMGLIVMLVRDWRKRPAPALADGVKPAQGAELDRFREQAREETEL